MNARTWSLLLILLAALILTGLVPGTALAQEQGGSDRPLVAHYVVAVLFVLAVMWAVCRTSHR